MKTLGVLANANKESTREVLPRLFAAAEALDMKLLFSDAETAALLPGSEAYNRAEFLDRIEGLITLGGDGTVLRGAQLLVEKDVPLLGINLGTLGFMTTFSSYRLSDVLVACHEDSLPVLERSLLEIRLKRYGQPDSEPFYALNDMAIGWGPSSRMVHLSVTIDGREVTGFSCDGCIVATPTGSTGHSLSAGGPILHPSVGGLILNPICPHTLSNRPLIVPHNSEIHLELSRASKKILLAADGQRHLEMDVGDVVKISCRDRGIRFLVPEDFDYYALLRNKLHWRGSSV